jgi:hypothetical protein
VAAGASKPLPICDCRLSIQDLQIADRQLEIDNAYAF